MNDGGLTDQFGKSCQPAINKSFLSHFYEPVHVLPRSEGNVMNNDLVHPANEVKVINNDFLPVLFVYITLDLHAVEICTVSTDRHHSYFQNFTVNFHQILRLQGLELLIG